MSPMLLFRSSRPIFYRFLWAIFVSTLACTCMVVGFGQSTSGGESVLMRTAYVAAACLLFPDVLEGAYIARGSAKTHRMLHFWIYAFYMGYFFALLNILIFWEGMENAGGLLLRWSLMGAFFGTIMSCVGAHKYEMMTDMYDLERPTTDHFLGFLYYGLPIFLVSILAGLYIGQPIDGWDDGYFLFQMVFLGSIMPLYSLEKSRLWELSMPRIVGGIILVYGLLAM